MMLPFFTGQIPTIGSMPLRFLFFGMPPIYPAGTAMSFEMAVCGMIIGLMYEHLPKRAWGIYLALGAAMISGRVVWGAAQIILLGLAGNAFIWEMFMAGAFTKAIPGIFLQIVLVPALILALQKIGALEPYEYKHTSMPNSETV